MALIARSFAERYAELAAYEPTFTDMLLDVQRREVGERKAIEEQFQTSFKDVLHVAAVMITDRKARTRGPASKMNRFELALYKKETAVWFPAAPPREVALPTGRPLRAFPHAAFAELCQEERELRQWLYGVERRLRQHIEEACGQAWFFLELLKTTVASENLSRQRLQRDEDESFTAVRRAFFRDVPADYYRHVVVTRYGETAPTTEHTYDDDVEYLEEVGRVALEEEEEAAGRAVYQYLQDAYGVQLFGVNHREVIARYEIEEAERNGIFPLVAQCCREDFGIVFYHVPSIALHLSSSQPCMRALCLAQLQEAPRRTAAVKARLSWCPPPGGVCDSEDEEEEEEADAEGDGAGDNVEFAPEEEAEVTEDLTDVAATDPSTHTELQDTARPQREAESSADSDDDNAAVAASADTAAVTQLGAAVDESASEVASPSSSKVRVVALTPRAHEGLEMVPEGEDVPLHSHYAYEETKVTMPVLNASATETPQPVAPASAVHEEVEEEEEAEEAAEDAVAEAHPTAVDEEAPECPEEEEVVDVAPEAEAEAEAEPKAEAEEAPEQQEVEGGEWAPAEQMEDEYLVQEEAAAAPATDEAAPEAHDATAAGEYPTEAATDAAADACAEAGDEL